MLEKLESRGLARAVACALLVVCFGLLMLDIGGDWLTHIDEFRTAERSREFLITRDWRTVRLNFEPDFKKPPLQYWATALTMMLTDNKQWPPRIWSAFGAIAALLATAWLAAAIQGNQKRNPWAPVLALLFCLLNSSFLSSARSALLDTWMLAFNTAALAAAVSARRNRYWWWACAACIALGAWQKAPTALGLVGGLCLLWVASGKRAFLRCRVFWLAMLSGLALAAAWPLWQWSIHGGGFVDTYFVHEMVERTGFIIERRSRSDAGLYLRKLWQQWGLLGVGSLVAVALVVVRGEMRRNRDLLAVSLLSVLLLAVLSGMAFRSPRYVVQLVPTLSMVVAHVLTSLTRGRGLFIGVLILTSMCWADVPRVFARPKLDVRADLVSAARTLGERAREDETFVLVRGRNSLARPVMMLYYADLSVAVHNVKEGERGIDRLPSSDAGYRGLAERRCWTLLKAYFPDASQESAHGAWIHWFSKTLNRSAEDAQAVECREERSR